MREAAGLLLEVAALALAVAVEAVEEVEVEGVVARPCYYWQCMSCLVPEYCDGHQEEEEVVVVVVDLLAAASLAAATASAVAAVVEAAAAVGTAAPDWALAPDPDFDFDLDPEPAALKPAFDFPEQLG